MPGRFRTFGRIRSKFATAIGRSGQFPPTFAEDFFNVGIGVILMPLVIPWGYVWRRYVERSGARWR